MSAGSGAHLEEADRAARQHRVVDGLLDEGLDHPGRAGDQHAVLVVQGESPSALQPLRSLDQQPVVERGDLFEDRGDGVVVRVGQLARQEAAKRVRAVAMGQLSQPYAHVEPGPQSVAVGRVGRKLVGEPIERQRSVGQTA
ncbi:MAG: hypothetical protein JRG85_03180 [Deltaproteobacteria bacterium]|nr:hypothetical protein [Deltaproteobacteria bacterium]